MEESCLLPFSACFLIPPMTTHAEMAPSTESWALPHQSSILKTSPQTWPQAKMVEATPCLRLPLPKWLVCVTGYPAELPVGASSSLNLNHHCHGVSRGPLSHSLRGIHLAFRAIIFLYMKALSFLGPSLWEILIHTTLLRQQECPHPFVKILSGVRGLSIRPPLLLFSSLTFASLFFSCSYLLFFSYILNILSGIGCPKKKKYCS